MKIEKYKPTFYFFFFFKYFIKKETQMRVRQKIILKNKFIKQEETL